MLVNIIKKYYGFRNGYGYEQQIVDYVCRFMYVLQFKNVRFFF